MRYKIFFTAILILPIVTGSYIRFLWEQSSRGKQNFGGITPEEHRGKQKSSFPWSDETLARLTLEEKVAQMMAVRAGGYYMSRDSEEWETLERMVTQRKVGCISFSLGDVYEYAIHINKLQRLSDIPLLIGADFEYGVGMRVKSTTTFPPAMAVGATRDSALAYKMSSVIAREARALGVQQNYAPDVDVNTNPRNPVINVRSYSDNVSLVNTMAEAYIKGLQDGGVIATAKHFPGHGETDIDIHIGLPVLRYSKETFERIEFPPFVRSIYAGVQSIMVGHLAVPTFDTADGIPATASSMLTIELLQNKLGFRGLIVTDALEMKGVTDKYTPAEAAVLAVKAGNDLILIPPDPDAAINAVVDAVKRGEISEERINTSVRKILLAKEKLGLHQNRYVDIEKINEVVATPEHIRLARTIARRAITVLGNTEQSLPLIRPSGKRVLTISFTDVEDPNVAVDVTNALRERCNSIEYARIDPHITKEEYKEAYKKAKKSDLLIYQFYFSVRSGKMTGFMPEKQISFIHRLSRLQKPIIAISFGNPYIIMNLPIPSAYVCAYAATDVMKRAALEVIFGEEPARGKLPIHIPGYYSYGDGAEYPKLVLRDGEPEEAGFDHKRFSEVDAIIEGGIRDSAFPGATLLVAKDGIVVYEKNYGLETYEPYSKPVPPSAIYDLASVSKVIGVTNSVMKLVSDGRLNLHTPVAQFLPEFSQRGKENITLYNLMVHNSGLPAWRKFYEFCNSPQCIMDSIYATPLVYKTGDSTIYSDLGLITMGKVVEKISGKPLDVFLDEEFYKPLGMHSTMFNPPQELHPRIMPTEIDMVWRKILYPVRGTVHDENAFVLGGISGHAGLFSTANDLAIMLQMLLNGGTYGGKRYIKEDVVKQFTSQQSPKSSRGIGWDTNNSRNRWTGTKLSQKSFIHTGFTGTSVVADPERNLIIVFLTNRVYPTRAQGKISRVRPAVHNAIVEALK